MGLLLTGIVIFFGGHSVIIVAPDFRKSIIDRFGTNGNRAVMSLISLVGLVLIIWGYSLARHDPMVIYEPPGWIRHITLTLMLLAFIILASAIFSGWTRHYVRHPILVATLLWSVAHLLSNGKLADIVLFGSFLIWVLVDLWSVQHRQGEAVEVTVSPAVRNDILAIVLGLLLYIAVVFGLHEWLIGVSPV